MRIIKKIKDQAEKVLSNFPITNKFYNYKCCASVQISSNIDKVLKKNTKLDIRTKQAKIIQKVH